MPSVPATRRGVAKPTTGTDSGVVQTFVFIVAETAETERAERAAAVDRRDAAPHERVSGLGDDVARGGRAEGPEGPGTASAVSSAS